MAGGECKGDCESEGREDSVMVREAVLDLYPERSRSEVLSGCIRTLYNKRQQFAYMFLARDPV